MQSEAVKEAAQTLKDAMTEWRLGRVTGCADIEHDKAQKLVYAINAMIEAAQSPASAVEDAVHDSKLKEAFGMFLNGLAYYETFPDDEKDAEQLRKAATYNFMRAARHISEELSGLCHAACKDVYAAEIARKPEAE